MCISSHSGGFAFITAALRDAWNEAAFRAHLFLLACKFECIGHSQRGTRRMTFQDPDVRCHSVFFSWTVKTGTEKGWSLLRFFRFCSTCHKSGWLCFQRSSHEAAGDNERDTENGHLIYKSGDVLEDRCRCGFSWKWWQPSNCNWKCTENVK